MEKKISKSALARSLGISRGSLYYVPKQILKDTSLKEKIVEALEEHPAYGHKRIAIHLDIGKNRALRVMALFGIKPKIRRRVPKYGAKTSVSGIPNRTKGISPIAPNAIWSGDFTYLHFHGSIVYFATVIDRFTREVLAWQVGLHHTTQLILDVLEDAFQKRGRSRIFHSDQGSEYTSNACIQWIIDHNILPSHSPKAKPWNNGHQESFFSTFKLEFGKPSRHETLPLLIEAIGRYIHYYNTKRIHGALRTPPKVFYEKEILKLKAAENPKL